jgi:hypothetical protein
VPLLVAKLLIAPSLVGGTSLAARRCHPPAPIAVGTGLIVGISWAAPLLRLLRVPSSEPVDDLAP